MEMNTESTTTTKNEKANNIWKTMGIILIIVLVIAGSGVGFLIKQNGDINKELSDSKDKVNSLQDQINEAENDSNESTAETNRDERYLVMEEWGLKFKIPTGIEDVKYVIDGDMAYFVARPFDTVYVSDLDIEDHAIGTLFRSKDSKIDSIGSGIVEGKKVGDYYYYTAHSFSDTASGLASMRPIESNNDFVAEGVGWYVWEVMNSVFLPSIELAE
ncbi:MAG: hypothetical protein LBM09_01185 [Candidatus Nomurabacteria bacterium]|jgi:archaellum component FlaG (FlaF/FlaG flagellin family)|nr:hypothetical protein [Candidatus Nomurabacteria bacterium]